MTSAIQVRHAASWLDRRRFLHLPWAIYQGNPNWVPPTLWLERQLTGMSSHPFYKTGIAHNLLAFKDGKPAGRLTAIINHTHNQKYNDKLGFFGFFECINDPDVSKALFEAGFHWLRQQGMTAVRGPANPSLNYTCGMLTDAFDKPPVFQMTYNREYYPALVEASGFKKSHDMYAYEMPPDLLARIAERYKPAIYAQLDRPDLKLRPFNPKTIRKDMETYLDIYNQALEGTWGFSPLTGAEILNIAAESSLLIEPEFSVFAELDGKAIGGVFALLDYNKIFITLNGRLFPFGYKLFTQRKSIHTARALCLTMLPGYQRSGLGIILLDDMMRPSAKRGITLWEFSWVLESNTKSRGSLERAGIGIAKTYRMYDRPL
jgi:hypothetical protein